MGARLFLNLIETIRWEMGGLSRMHSLGAAELKKSVSVGVVAGAEENEVQWNFKLWMQDHASQETLHP